MYFPFLSGASCGSDAVLAPWQSFEEPRCDLRENLLRSGCGEASIVYTRGEMRTLKVCAGTQPLLSASSRLLHPSLGSSSGKTRIRSLFM